MHVHFHPQLKRVYIPALLVAAGVALTACTPPVDSTDPSLTAARAENASTNTTEKETMVNPATETEKTLADFEPIEATQATLHTSKGDITFELYRDEVPLTTLNFLSLAKDGFYDGIVFHRVIEGFMAQAGDPLTKDPSAEARWGTGGPGYTIADEFDPSLTHDSEGIVSMANRGPDTGGSQFFITFAPTPHLDGKHAVFAKVTQGLDVLEQITQGDTIDSVSFE